MRVSPDSPRSPKSFGDYLCLSDAADMIGSKLIEGWRHSDLAQLDKPRDASDDLEAWDRVQIARKRILDWLSGGRLVAFGQDDEGSYFELDRGRLSKPYFEVDLLRSRFTWAPEQWDSLFIGKTALTQLLNSFGRSGPRKSVTYDWQDIACIAWKLALDDLTLRRPSLLIAAVQDRYHEKYDQHPDEKELRGLARIIIEHLGDRTLSRDETK